MSAAPRESAPGWTPGPYHTQQADSHIWHICAPPPSKRGSAVRVATAVQGEHDANLLAAAPALYEALADLVQRINLGAVHLSDTEMARKALAAARAGATPEGKP